MMGARAVHWRLGCRFSAVWVGMGGAGAMPGRGEAALKESAPPSSAQGAGAVRGKLTGTFRVGYKINTNHRPFSLWGRPRGASIGSPNEVRPVMLSLLVIVLLSYFLGSIPGALWSSKALHGVDIRNYGSKNAGATNAFRVVGWPAGVLAMIVDLGKGFLAAGVVASYVRIDPLPELSIFGWETGVVLGLIAGFVAILGHMFPIFARFEGGKGVATAAGILFALTPITMLYTVLVYRSRPLPPPSHFPPSWPFVATPSGRTLTQACWCLVSSSERPSWWPISQTFAGCFRETRTALALSNRRRECWGEGKFDRFFRALSPSRLPAPRPV